MVQRSSDITTYSQIVMSVIELGMQYVEPMETYHSRAFKHFLYFYWVLEDLKIK